MAAKKRPPTVTACDPDAENPEADRWYARALALGERCAELRAEARRLDGRLVEMHDAHDALSAVLAEAVERASHEPVVEWYRAAKRVLRGES